MVRQSVGIAAISNDRLAIETPAHPVPRSVTCSCICTCRHVTEHGGDKPVNPNARELVHDNVSSSPAEYVRASLDLLYESELRGRRL